MADSHSDSDRLKLLPKPWGEGALGTTHSRWWRCGIPFMTATVVVVVVVGCLVLLLSQQTTMHRSNPEWNFIKAQGTIFRDGPSQYIVTGVNIYNLIELYMKDQDLVEQRLRDISSDGINVIRVFAHSTHSEYRMQIRSKQYSTQSLQALDAILDTCAKVNIRLLLSFADTWMYHGGVQEYLDFSETLPDEFHMDQRIKTGLDTQEGDFDFSTMDQNTTDWLKLRQTLFFSDSGARELYKYHMATLLNRKNEKNGIMYKDDPSIFGFGLLNELRCEVAYDKHCPDMVHDFLEDVVSYFRSIDTNHLLTVGEEGFYYASGSEAFNPPGGWAEKQGQDFTTDHDIEGISFRSFHAWSKNWNEKLNVRDEVVFLNSWIESHMNASSKREMPLLLEEVGRQLEPGQSVAKTRDPIIKAVFHNVEQSVAAHQSLQGSLLWEYTVQSDRASSRYAIHRASSTYGLLKRHINNIMQIIHTN